MEYINFLLEIGERAYKAAYNRGKKTSVPACIEAAHRELGEYWEAHDLDKKCTKHDQRVAKCLAENTEFIKFYEENIHNTDLDELADLCIVAATWCYASYLVSVQREEQWDPKRDLDTVMCSGFVAFALCTIDDAEVFANAINNKMRYNELRKD